MTYLHNTTKFGKKGSTPYNTTITNSMTKAIATLLVRDSMDTVCRVCAEL